MQLKKLSDRFVKAPADTEKLQTTEAQESEATSAVLQQCPLLEKIQQTFFITELGHLIELSDANAHTAKIRYYFWT